MQSDICALVIFNVDGYFGGSLEVLSIQRLKVLHVSENNVVKLRRGAARRAPNRGSAGFDTTASAIACVGVGTATSTDLTDGMTDGRSGAATADASANNGSSLRSTTVDS